ncbi:MAG: LamG-like jellyroll fold domain-containing protein, partial [Planctomycetota bacterium]
MKLTFVIFVLGLVLTDAAIGQPANLYARWLLNEGEGEVVFDISGNDLHGIIHNADNGLGLDGSVWVDDPVRGAVISFDGTAEGAFVRAGEIPQMTLTNDFTWAFWAKQNAENTANNDIILGNRKDENAVDFVPRQFIKFTPTKFEWHMNGNGNNNLDYVDIPADVWLHHAVVKTADQLTYYRNGVESSSGTFTQPLDVPQPLFLGGDNEGSAGENWSGLMSDVQLYARALTADEVLQVMALQVGPVIRASSYEEIPSNAAIDVSIDTDLSWTAGDYADTHDVYFSTVFEDVNDADRTNWLDALLSQDQGPNVYDLGRLDYGQTYYWRIDDVNAPLTGSTVFKGRTWQFVTELFSYAIPGERIIATASSWSEESGGPEKTIDGSGLTSVTHPIDTGDDTHSTEIPDMWVSSKTDIAPWIQYNFDKPFKLDGMLVWNFNGITIWNMLGLKVVNVEYSTDGGATWRHLSNVPEFARAAGTNGYHANTIVPFGNLVVNAVRLTATSNWSRGISARCGLSEVDFLAIPTYASAPYPQNGARNVVADATLYWKAGREAARH